MLETSGSLVEKREGGEAADLDEFESLAICLAAAIAGSEVPRPELLLSRAIEFLVRQGAISSTENAIPGIGEAVGELIASAKEVSALWDKHDLAHRETT